ncbi:hypothetical protein [Thermodesulfovibrio thiophilus]|uniref:hypothetical protein n=1 Tax=Thermodesulfovibrio thiophilus TaxID=340095 RepID=UPI000410B12C|nr:hypothetical protein [Thermodesulfovibrio thiophilus]
MDNEQVEFAKTLYGTLAQSVRELEKNFLTLIVQLIASLGVYGAGLVYYVEHVKVNSCYSVLILIAATIVAIFILIILRLSCNIFAYTSRSNQIVMAKIENKVGICGNIVPTKWCQAINIDDPPEIYKFFKLISSIAILLIIGIDLLIIIIDFLIIGIDLKIFNDLIKTPNIIFIIFIMFIIFIFILTCVFEKFAWNSYKDKLRKLKS